MLEKLSTASGTETAELVRRIGKAAEDLGVSANLVGGPVRDTLLGRPTADVDIMIEGDAAAFARALEQNWKKYFPHLPAPNPPVSFKKYLTAKLNFPEPLFGRMQTLDFVSARQEEYPTSGAPPIVSPGDLRTDLERRDFAVNAMALRLSGEERGKVYDFHRGRTDLDAGVLSVLHVNSFVDDPARLLRALRFGARLGFKLSEQTTQLFDEALAQRYIERLPKFRLLDELRKALLEPDVLSVVAAMEQVKLLAQAHPGLALTDAFVAAAGADFADAEPPELWQLRFVLLGDALSDIRFEELLRDLEVNKKLAAQLMQARHWWRRHFRR